MAPDPKLTPYNRLSQINAITQCEHLLTYPAVRDAVLAKRLRLHAWWFDLSHADVYAYDLLQKRFFLIDENSAGPLLEKLF